MSEKAFVEVLKYGASYDSMIITQRDSAVLSKEDLTKFLDLLGDTKLMNLRTDSSGMFDADGGETYFSVVQGTNKNDFVAGDNATFHAGNRYQHLIDATFYLLYAKFPDLEKFIEQNHRYHSHDFPVKIRGRNPRQIRLWAQYFDGDSILLSKLLRSFPPAEPLIVDISNLQNFADVETVLLDFERTHPKMVWVIGDVQRNSDDYSWKFYKSPGFDTNRMFRDTIGAKQYLLKLENGG